MTFSSSSFKNTVAVNGSLYTKVMNLLPELVDLTLEFTDDFDVTMYNLACNKEGPLDGRVLCQEAAKRNNLTLLKDLSEKFPVTDEVYAYLAKNGNIEGLKWLQEKNSSVPENVRYIGIRTVEQGHLECLKWMLENGYELCHHFLVTAAKNGYLDMVKFLFENRVMLTEEVALAAVKSRSLPLVQWLFEHDCPYQDDYSFPIEAMQGSLEVLKYLIPKYLSIENPEDIDYCLKSGNLEMTKWLYEHYQSLFEEFSCDHACESGNLELIEWLEERGFALEPKHFSSALASGNIVLLERIQRGHELTEFNFVEASCVGNIAILEYLKELNCPLNSSRCYLSAAEYCQLEVLVWLKKNDYPLTSDEFNTSEEIEQYMLDLGPPGIVEDVDPILKMGDEEDMTPIYNWIHTNVRSIRHA